MKRSTLVLCATTLAAAVASAGCQSRSTTTPTTTTADQAAPEEARGARLYSGFGNYTRRVSTDSRQAQRWFDQGMQLLYGFNHDEAIRSFHEAAKHDPDCAMAWWGIAYAHGLHINNPQMSAEQSERAYDASLEAMKRINNASPVEQALIRAVCTRYAWPIPADRKPLDLAYADTMERAWQMFPDDPDVGALFAESLMNLQPWDLWTREGEPKGRTLEIIAAIERVLELREDHPGANHFYIHAVEASTTPQRAVPAAERLAELVPGSGHLVHMPAHIFARVGRYDDACDYNERAIQVDRDYFAVAPPPNFYSLYFVHNIHFLAWSAMMEGRYETAMTAARDLEAGIPADFLRDWTFVADGFMPVTYHVMIRFGKWDEILAEPEPAEFRLVSRAMWRYARGVALSALGRTDEARAELGAFESAAAAVPPDWKVGQNIANNVMDVARCMLKGELAYREGNYEECFALLREGIALEDNLVYDEPPGWMQPVRHALGALLLGIDRAEEAEQVYREDLARNMNNGWSLLGLEQALRAQGKTEEADTLEAQRDEAWARADVQPTSSCYCQPGS
jgi:tetratricopeptide (TPR) repeat protein